MPSVAKKINPLLIFNLLLFPSPCFPPSHPLRLFSRVFSFSYYLRLHFMRAFSFHVFNFFFIVCAYSCMRVCVHLTIFFCFFLGFFYSFVLRSIPSLLRSQEAVDSMYSTIINLNTENKLIKKDCWRYQFIDHMEKWVPSSPNIIRTLPRTCCPAYFPGAIFVRRRGNVWDAECSRPTHTCFLLNSCRVFFF